MRQNLYDTQLRDQANARETARVVSALDNTSVNLMIADANRQIIYMNSSVRRMLKKAEPELRKALPSFDVDKLIGKSMDEFHKNPSHQSHLLASLTTTYQAKISVAGFHFRLIANPIFDSKAERLGSVVEWQDITDEVNTEAEVAALIEAASLGNFSSRLELSGKVGFFKILTEGINSLLDTTERGLNDVGAMFTALAAGNLTHRMAGDYSGMFARLQDDANLTVERLTEIVNQIKESSDTILTAAREIAAGNQNLSQRTESQAASLEETASAMEELTSTVKQNAENSRQANQLARGASDIAEKAGGVVGEVVDTMKGINSSANKIVDIIAVIDDIAFQTNILALNAAVEAARAGEQGRGFAVVASEVRNLAQRSAAAAKEIKQLINDSVDKVESGSLLVNQAGQTMEEVVNSVKHVTDIMSEISAASTEQSAGIQEVNQTVTQMDDMTQQNAALVEEAAAAAKSLEEQSHRLTEAVSAFRLTNESSSRSPRTYVHTATPVELPSRETSREESPSSNKASKKKTTDSSSTSRRLPKTIAEDDWEHF
nr:methyl-accepting chemotaxis protein [Chitinimonas prasina]